MRPLRVLTWHIHGSYLYFLAQTGHEIYLPVKPDRPEGYYGRTPSYPWPDNVIEIDAQDVADAPFDCILFQSKKNYAEDQFEILSAQQRQLPRLYLEHDPPREHPTDTPHHVDDPEILLVHVTAFNELMWDNRRTPTCVVDHGVLEPPNVRYTGELDRGIVVVNNIHKRGRRLGLDVFLRVREEIPLDLVGMGSLEVDGLGEIPHAELPAFSARYRFFFNPIRYTSLGLSVCEAMMIGLPIIGLQTTEMVTAVQNGVSGYLATDVDQLIAHMKRLLAHPAEARQLSEGARQAALQRFSIQRFKRDWDAAFARALSMSSPPARARRDRLSGVGEAVRS